MISFNIAQKLEKFNEKFKKIRAEVQRNDIHNKKKTKFDKKYKDLY